jgi:MFS family permease
MHALCLTLHRYLLTTAAFQLPFGKLYSILSVKYTFLVSIIIFEIGSLICGAANSSAVLIAGRAIAGVGGAGIFSGALIIAAHTSTSFGIIPHRICANHCSSSVAIPSNLHWCCWCNLWYCRHLRPASGWRAY